MLSQGVLIIIYKQAIFPACLTSFILLSYSSFNSADKALARLAIFFYGQPVHLREDTFTSSSPFVPLMIPQCVGKCQRKQWSRLSDGSDGSVGYGDRSISVPPSSQISLGEEEEEVSADPELRVKQERPDLRSWLWIPQGGGRDRDIKMYLFGLMSMLNYNKLWLIFSVHSWAERKRNDTHQGKENCKDYFSSSTRREP